MSPSGFRGISCFTLTSLVVRLAPVLALGAVEIPVEAIHYNHEMTQSPRMGGGSKPS
jgi:hypothetical protein